MAEYVARMRSGWHDAAAEFEEEVISQSPLRYLTRQQITLVQRAEHLYETVGVAPSASLPEIRAAYHARCKAAHPDLQEDSAAANDEMVSLNLAWEILREDELRAAYDWIQEHHRTAAV